jgi:hypothetical protein
MLMGSGWSRSPFTGVSIIENQALILFISLPGESFSRHHVALPFADGTDAKEPDESGALKWVSPAMPIWPTSKRYEKHMRDKRIFRFPLTSSSWRVSN